MTCAGQIIIPDRLVITQSKCAVIIDYKTEVYYDKHQQQLENYALIIKQMGYKIDKKILDINSKIYVQLFSVNRNEMKFTCSFPLMLCNVQILIYERKRNSSNLCNMQTLFSWPTYLHVWEINKCDISRIISFET